MKLWYISIGVGNQLSLNNWSSEIIGLTSNDRSSIIITKWRNLLVQISLIFHQGASQRNASFWVFWLRATFINDNRFVPAQWPCLIMKVAAVRCFRMQQRLAFFRQPDSWKGPEMKSEGKKAKGKKGRGREELKPSLPTPHPLADISCSLVFAPSPLSDTWNGRSRTYLKDCFWLAGKTIRIVT